MLAVEIMDPGWQAAFYIIGVALFLYAGVQSALGRVFNAVAFGLAAVFFVAAWNALALT